MVQGSSFAIKPKQAAEIVKALETRQALGLVSCATECTGVRIHKRQDDPSIVALLFRIPATSSSGGMDDGAERGGGATRA